MSSSDEASSPPPPLPLPAHGARWRCEYCTYDNWSKASRCGMCKAARAIRVIKAEAADKAAAAAEGTVVAAEDDGGGDAAEKNNNSRNASSTDIYSLSGAASSTSAWNYDQVRIVHLLLQSYILDHYPGEIISTLANNISITFGRIIVHNFEGP